MARDCPAPDAPSPTTPASPRAAPSGLRWVSDAEPGLRRRRRGRAFSYHDEDGRLLREAGVLDRIRRLAIPPAWREVWICARPDGHLQATGLDARGRKQYRYHPEWQQQRGRTKFAHLREFGRLLPRIRAQVERQLAGADTPTRTRLLATLVRLLDTTWLRIGNDAYARSNGSYGLSTLRHRHVTVQGSELRLSFVGKSGVRHDVALSDRRVARVVRRCRELPGQELFRHVDADGEVRRIGSADVNAWLAEVAGPGITAKDFRTWHGSVQALELTLAAHPRHAVTLAGDPPTLAHSLGQRYSVSPRRSGRAPELDDPATLEWIGRFIGRMHAVGATQRFEHRGSLDIATFGSGARDYLLAHDWVPPEALPGWRAAIDNALGEVQRAFDGLPELRTLRLHGDCHPGNILWSDAGPHFVDLDDALTGPAVQDLWMLLSGERASMTRQLGAVLAGYEDFMDFDWRELRLVEPLRTLRLIHHSAWIARRWGDPAFPPAFPWFAGGAYWGQQTIQLEEQIDAMREAPLGAPPG